MLDPALVTFFIDIFHGSLLLKSWWCWSSPMGLGVGRWGVGWFNMCWVWWIRAPEGWCLAAFGGVGVAAY